jgi:hypothetical protein
MIKEILFDGAMRQVVTVFLGKYAIRYEDKVILVNKPEFENLNEQSVSGNSLNGLLGSAKNAEEMKIKVHEELITEILVKKPISRDSDFALYKFLLLALGNDPTKITADTLLIGMYQGIYPSWESVGRIRRLVQNKREDLRGENYEKRHKEQDAVQAELGYIPTAEGAPGTTP